MQHFIEGTSNYNQDEQFHVLLVSSFLEITEFVLARLDVGLTGVKFQQLPLVIKIRSDGPIVLAVAFEAP